jgi:hypothetical protein
MMPFHEIAELTCLTEKEVANAYGSAIRKLRRKKNAIRHLQILAALIQVERERKEILTWS